jgi:hypothetical protein
VIAICLLTRTLSNFRGGIILLRARRLVEARIMARCCFENLFSAAALGQDGPGFISLLEADDGASRKARAQFLLEHAPLDVEERDNDPLRLFLRDLQTKRRKGRTLTPKEVATRGPLVKAYAYYAELSADAGHPTLASLLGRYVNKTKDDEEEITTLDIEPTINSEEARATLFYLCEALLGVCVWSNTIIENPAMEPETQKVLDQYKDFAEPKGPIADV